jgi:predicted pyridoxine 5'-phosphate oxidase superfamily flavin-nucleotide-binding protein
VNGTAHIVTDGDYFDDMIVRADRPVLALVVGVEEAFFHCPKALVRSRAWDTDHWAPDSVRPYPEIAKALWANDESLDAIAARNTPEMIETQLYPDRVSDTP